MSKYQCVKTLGVISSTIIKLIDGLKDAGCSGIYYCSLGAEETRFSDELYCKYIKPWDEKILSYVNQKEMYSFLHICKDNVALPRFTDTCAQIINWAVHDCRYSLADGRSLFENKVLLGGFDDRSGELCDGTKEDIRKKAESIVNSAGRKNLIAGCDCTLPDNVEMWRLKYAKDVIHSL